jgi:LysM repeat protein
VPAAYAGLKPCPDAPDCYLYRIHAGDNLTAIAKRFGITLVALKAANPEVKDPSLLHVGDKIRVPLPTS